MILNFYSFICLPCLVDSECPSPPKPEHLESPSLSIGENICAKPKLFGWLLLIYRCTARHIQASPVAP